MHAWILVDGRLSARPDLAAGWPAPDLVVAADGGYRHAAALGVAVDAWVGDFDSSNGLSADLPREVHPRDKNQTDAELALDLARRRGATSATVWGAFGGRFDHTLALALLAVRMSGAGFAISLSSGDEAGWPLLPGRPLDLAARPGDTLSVLALDDLRGLSLGGVRWPLRGADVPSGSGWTVSNTVSDGGQAARVQASLSGGRALLVLGRHDLRRPT